MKSYTDFTFIKVFFINSTRISFILSSMLIQHELPIYVMPNFINEISNFSFISTYQAYMYRSYQDRGENSIFCLNFSK